MATLPRVPLEDVISDPKLMKPIWDKLSRPQQVVIKAFYGLPITDEAELAIWAILCGNVVYDALGYPLSITPTPYTPREYTKLVGILGRRSGKSVKIVAFINLYEIIFGGHLESVAPGQDVVVPYIAQDLATAKSNMAGIALMAKESAKIEAQIDWGATSREKITFRNGIVIQAEPPAIKTGRGFAMPIVNMDEVGFWYRTAEAANPDVEVQRAVNYAQLQFANGKQILISTPYAEEGLLWDYWKAGTAGYKLPLEDQGEYEDTLVIQASTAAMENPTITAKKLARLQQEDPEAFVRESLAQFVSAIAGFIPQELVQAALQPGIKERTREQNEKGSVLPMYVGVMDPAFRHDTFAFSIFHMEPDGSVVQDLLRTWTPDKKTKVTLDPAVIIAEVGDYARAWNLPAVFSDQYQLEALQQLAMARGFTIVGNDFTGKSKAKMYGSVLQLLRTGKLKLLDLPVVYQQMTQLQKKLNGMGGISIAAPPGKHDDVASVIALGTTVALLSYPSIKPPEKPKTLMAEGIECIRRKQQAALQEAWV